ncbi:hypothetical protein FXN63_17825 [Pigmentiphaga aceris]|uniref:Uncharacterized protein n=1 Tax=Pigmentiphaga aceris TaxID=1940612 RepID=A0A5C0B2S5_9BURK|nr:hypothetical protein [Pigmentiphaga aceris]QEI07490.1 hypothetical protein FXN63_17825 [Pigmentiphaga aceris]
MTQKKPTKTEQPGQQQQAQADDVSRDEQRSHGSEQNRSKKDGHTSQIGTGADQQSGRNHGQGARRPN